MASLIDDLELRGIQTGNGARENYPNLRPPVALKKS
jgi:hypothetical protein